MMVFVALLSVMVRPLAVAPEPLEGHVDNKSTKRSQTMLTVSVRYGGARESEQSAVGSRHYQTADRNEIQQLRMLEGDTAYLTRSSEQPYPSIVALPAQGAGYPVVGGLDYRELRTGFTVTPTVQGDEAILDIAVETAQQSQRGAGAIDSTRLQTRVRGALGSWISLRGVGLPAQAGTGKKSYSTAPRAQASDQDIWVRVDLEN
tara:strand:- start:66763 stop:67374 length:612 start_codon:yes stop_codon:yes gene_type:complete